MARASTARAISHADRQLFASADRVDPSKATAHGELVIEADVQALEGVDCGSGDGEIDVRF